MTDYSPFPEGDLREMELEFTQRAALWQGAAKGGQSAIASDYLGWAKACSNAIACHDALRERFLEEVTALRGELGRLRQEVA